jgi:prephenate dehydrogenase
MPPARRALIAGLGLIGGSIGLALRAHGWSVDFVDPNVSAADALSRGAADRKLEDIPVVPEADVVVLAMPVDAVLATLETIDPGALTTTVCSVMEPVSEVSRRRGLRCVPGHPLAGSQESSLAAADIDLFRGKKWFVEEGSSEPIVAELASACGAAVERINAREHDRILALTSHLPQLFSTALAALLDGDTELARYAGTGLRSFLRLAGSEGNVWRPVLGANRENLTGPVRDIAAIASQILDGTDDDAFARAQHFLAALEQQEKDA